MLDEKALERAKELAERLQKAAGEEGLPTEPIPAEDAPFPAFLLEAPSDYQEEGWAVACTVVPLEAGGDRFICVQLYACITPLIPRAWLEDARRLIEGENERLLFGNLLLFSSRMSLKYVFSPPDGATVEPERLLHILRIFTRQADACAERCDALVEGRADVETLLGESAFRD